MGLWRSVGQGVDGVGMQAELQTRPADWISGDSAYAACAANARTPQLVGGLSAADATGQESQVCMLSVVIVVMSKRSRFRRQLDFPTSRGVCW